MRFRFLNKLYAKINGYFWKRCPLCKQYFGGHEWKYEWKHGLNFGVILKANNPYVGIAICPDCFEKQKKGIIEVKSIKPTLWWRGKVRSNSKIIFETNKEVRKNEKNQKSKI